MPALAQHRRIALFAALALLATPLAACSKDPEPGPALDAFVAGWPHAQWNGKVTFVGPQNQALTETDVANRLKGLSGTLDTVTVKADGKPTISDKSATGKITVDWTLPGGTHWTYPSQVRLTQQNKTWRVIWDPKIVHPDLQENAALNTKVVAAARAGINDAAGNPLATARNVVVVGVEPDKIKDLAVLTPVLDSALKTVVPGGVDLSGLAQQVAQAKPDAFVEIVTLRREAYDQIKPMIHDLDGTVFREETRILAPTRTFAKALFGSVGEVTKEIMDANPGKYAQGDQVGLYGLQKQYDARLRGSDGVEVDITSKNADGTTRTQKVFGADAKDGQALSVTLDPKVQNAADGAIAGSKLTQRTAIVAMRVSDGHVLAVANGPDGGGDDLALVAQVPPGSTFKVVTAYGVLDGGSVTADSVVDCPATYTVDGRTFKNAHDMALGPVPFHTDLAKSCNTAFASLAPKLGDTGLAAAGTALGLGTKWDLGVDCFTGAVSSGGSQAEQAAAAFGQGTTVVSPVAMLGAIGAVARGRWKQPVLLLDPAPAAPAADGPQLKESTLTQLRTGLREVVTNGTAVSLKDVPGGPVSGKTGTAEYDADPAHTHAWFIGWQGDLAFAVFVENGGDSTATAVPLAEAFLRGLQPQTVRR
ncbi:penicillin-binding transpeptidase domain-containing protein [Hamadaea tsunoensis]|uniref:penicillin-binding transpeptidase domain-containing protein n=1 Tax=Hamadaea tsunoensis TaxID=53368 RepID=UPI001FDFF4D6|nr:penicillin-binding transpeptidase domain-containing protein [Hamadaea tsunoensis]